MSSSTRGPGDTTFERRLLASARADAAPHRVEEAWTRFAARLGSLLPDSDGNGGGSGGRVSAGGAGAGVARRVAAKWLLVGALGGGGLTAGMGMMLQRPAPAPVPAAAERVTPPAVHNGGSVTPPVASEERPAVPRPAAHRLSRAGTPSHRRVRRVEGSTLAAEVSRIDIARMAVASGEFDEAIRVIRRYHDEFPEGALSPDADVVALEAAVGKQDRAEVQQRARTFLARHPNDPHAARVRWLADHVLSP